MKLFCFTHAGGNATFFDRIHQQLSTEIEVIAIEYAGHGSRSKEPFYTTFSEMAMDLYPQIKDRLDGWDDKYALFGYSMGTLAVTEIMQCIIADKDMCMPVHIFLGAHDPQVKLDVDGYNELDIDDFIKKRIIRFGGIPKRLIQNKSFWRVYFPMYRADFSMIGRFDFDKVEWKTDIPLTVFYSEEDTAYKDVVKWKDIFIGESDFIEYEGNHFFINRFYKEMASEIEKRLI